MSNNKEALGNQQHTSQSKVDHPTETMKGHTAYGRTTPSDTNDQNETTYKDELKMDDLKQYLPSSLDIQNKVDELEKYYQYWSEPLNRNRLRYSPNECLRMLRQHIRDYINAIAQDMINAGFSMNETRIHCQNIADSLTQELKNRNIGIGQLHLTPA